MQKIRRCSWIYKNSEPDFSKKDRLRRRFLYIFCKNAQALKKQADILAFAACSMYNRYIGGDCMHFTVGMLAHVDAGKTTFCEQLLYQSRAIRALGRVDHADAFMDDHPLERQRGITIFSAQAAIQAGENTLQLVDTPGHADFSGEMERAVSVIDAAVLLISCAEGIQAHTRTVWKILRRYNVPVCIFLNKTDRAGANPDGLIEELRAEFSADIADLRTWPEEEAFAEEIAGRDEKLLDKYLGGEFDRELWLKAFSRQFRAREIFPVLAGSALQGEGVSEALDLLTKLFERFPNPEAKISEPFSARVYKVKADSQYGRLSYMKVLSGTIAPRDKIGPEEEKITNLFSVQGGRLSVLDKAVPGMLCAAAGLSARAGERIGHGAGEEQKELSPMLTTSAELLDNVSPSKLLAAMRVLEDEDPLLQAQWQEKTQTVAVRVMGTVQLETMTEILKSRFGLNVRFGPCKVRYMETISAPVMGVGHYEPLRHYAEVRVRLEPMPRGSGITFASECHVDFLPLQWQNTIREILLKKKHKCVLTGAELTDVKIVLVNGRHHLKHTEGGDFYEAACRAVRNALMQAQSVLLEPICRFNIAAQAGQYDLLMRELIRIQADTDLMERTTARCELGGTAAASSFIELLGQLPALTHGQGSAQWEHIGYEPCHNAAEVIAEEAYSPLADTENSPHSVFCAKGAGFTVNWDEVENYAHTALSANYGN